MAKIVSAVPQLLTGTIGALVTDPPKPVSAAPVVTAVADTPASPDKTAATDTSISGPDLSGDLDPLDARSRGRIGTIATSFRGVLNDTSAMLPRRTLLGE